LYMNDLQSYQSEVLQLLSLPWSKII